MRIPPLLADFIYNRGCELKCEKFLTRPRKWEHLSTRGKNGKEKPLLHGCVDFHVTAVFIDNTQKD